MHNVKLEAWLDDQKADQPSRLAVEALAATAAGVPATGIGQKFSVLGLSQKLGCILPVRA